MKPEHILRAEDGRAVPTLVWRLVEPALAISSGPLGGGIGRRSWVLNATVPMSYNRTDPDVHLGDIAAGLDLTGPGVGLLTGVDVGERVDTEDGGVRVTATVGLGAPAWASAPDGDQRRYQAGTVNMVAWVPVPLAPAALVNAVATATEAKSQALWELGVAATGTASDAICVLCAPAGTPEPFGGTRSTWGARLARAVHAGVLTAGRDWLASPRAWAP